MSRSFGELVLNSTLGYIYALTWSAPQNDLSEKLVTLKITYAIFDDPP